MKNHVLIILGGIVLALGCQAPAEAPSLSEEDIAAIDSTIEAAQVTWNEGGAETYVNSFYTEDVVFMPPNHPIIHGASELISYLNNFPDISISFESVMKEGAGNLAYNHGTYVLSTTDESGNIMEVDRGKFIEIWEKQEDGSWLISHDIFNSDNPIPIDDEVDMDEEGDMDVEE